MWVKGLKKLQNQQKFLSHCKLGCTVLTIWSTHADLEYVSFSIMFTIMTSYDHCLFELVSGTEQKFFQDISLSFVS